MITVLCHSRFSAVTQSCLCFEVTRGSTDTCSMLAAAVAKARDAYTRANPRSQQANGAAARHLPGGNTRTVIHASPFPLTFVGGHGSRLVTLDGHEYVDFLSEYSAGLFGHSCPEVRAAVDVALARGCSFGGPHPDERALAAALCSRFAPAVERLRFTNSGTEANMYALAAAKAWTGNSHILVFEGGYHGGSIGFLSGQPDPMLLPHQWIVAPYNDIDGTRACVDAALGPSAKLAAVLVEPMQGSGGANPASPAFLHALRSVADERSALLIFDEVMTSRLAWSGLGQAHGVRPDLMTLGKWIAGGMPAGAFGGRADVLDQFDPSLPGALRHAGTFNNNSVSMAAGLAAMPLYTAPRVDALNALGERLKEQVGRVLADAGFQNPPPGPPRSARPIVDDAPGAPTRAWISGVGSIMAVRFAGPHALDLQALFWHKMLDHGVYLAARGFVSLNLETAAMDVDRFVAGARSFVDEYLVASKSERAKL